MLSIEDNKPKFADMKRGRNDATFGVNATTYNESGYTYNQSGNTYGGADRISDIGPKILSVKEIKP